MRASSEILDTSVMDKTGVGMQLELVMFESAVSDTQLSDVSPTSDIQVSLNSAQFDFVFIHICFCMFHYYNYI